MISTVPENLTRRQCTAKVAEIFDLTGMFTPIVSAMKIDLHELVSRKLDWEDQVTVTLQPLWINHFKTMAEMGKFKFNRAVIPIDAVSKNMNLLSFGDESRYSMLFVFLYTQDLEEEMVNIHVNLCLDVQN